MNNDFNFVKKASTEQQIVNVNKAASSKLQLFPSLKAKTPKFATENLITNTDLDNEREKNNRYNDNIDETLDMDFKAEEDLEKIESCNVSTSEFLLGYIDPSNIKSNTKPIKTNTNYPNTTEFNVNESKTEDKANLDRKSSNKSSNTKQDSNQANNQNNKLVSKQRLRTSKTDKSSEEFKRPIKKTNSTKESSNTSNNNIKDNTTNGVSIVKVDLTSYSNVNNSNNIVTNEKDKNKKKLNLTDVDYTFTNFNQNTGALNDFINSETEVPKFSAKVLSRAKPQDIPAMATMPIPQVESNKMIFDNSVVINLNETITSPTKSFQDLDSLYKTGLDTIILIGGKSDIYTRQYNIETNVWSVIKSVGIDRSDFCALMYKDKKILILGGKTSNHIGLETVTDTMELLDFDEKTVKKIEIKLKHIRSSFGAVYSLNKLFVIGGYTGKDVINNCEYFDKKLTKWVDLPKMNTRRKEFAIVLEPDNFIYVLGGSDEKE